MSSKSVTLFLVALLFLFTLSSASRPNPLSPQPAITQLQEGIKKDQESCKGLGEEECLMRRTLAAHLDYIYTQKENKP